MCEKLLFRSLAVVAFAAALLATAAHAGTMIMHGATSINMDFVSVGNPGNAAQIYEGYGRVDYAYRIGKYEVSESQWDAVVAADGSDLLSDPGCWSGEQPVASISWHEAAMFCNWLTSGNVTQGYYSISGGEATPNALDHNAYAAIHGTTYFIPTENEWCKAAYYDPNKGGEGVPGYWNYPTKHDSPKPDGIDFDGDTAFDAVFFDEYDQGHPNDVDNAGVLSAYGTIGQGGNVWEWNETAINSSRGSRGGGWHYNYISLTMFYRSGGDPTSGYSSRGFRVASSDAVPEPNCIALLVGGGIAGMIWWRRRR